MSIPSLPHEELWYAIHNLHRLLYKQRARIEKLEALQWTEEEIDKLVGSGLLGHMEKGDKPCTGP